MLFNGIAVKFEDVAKMCLFFMKNEDNIYPPEKGFKGAELFKQYIKEVLDKMGNEKKDGELVAEKKVSIF